MILFLFFFPDEKTTDFRLVHRRHNRVGVANTHFLLTRLNRIKNNDLSGLVYFEPSYIFDSETNNLLVLQ